MAEVRLTMEEYEALLERHIAARSKTKAKELKAHKKRKGTPLKGMSAALKKANAKAKLKSGKFRKGWDQARVMKEAHRLRKRSR